MFIINQTMGKTISYRNWGITTTIRKGKKYWIIVEDCFGQYEEYWQLIDTLKQAKNLIDFYEEKKKLNAEGYEEEEVLELDWLVE